MSQAQTLTKAHATQQVHAMRPSSKQRMRTGNPALGTGGVAPRFLGL